MDDFSEPQHHTYNDCESTDYNINTLNSKKIYYTVSDYNKIKFLKNCLSLISININSLRKHANELIVFIESLKTTPDIIILSEIRHNIEEILNFSFSNYKHHLTYPVNNKCGGVAILIKNDISHKLIPEYQILHQGIENLVIKVETTSDPLYISGIYKHPNIRPETVLKLLKDQNSYIPSNAKLIIAGDLNIDYCKYESSNQIKNYFDSLLSKKVYQLITAPTRITCNSKTIIDHLYIRTNKLINIYRGIFVDPISDHLCTFIQIQQKVHTNYSNRPFVRIMGDNNITYFRNEINLHLNAMYPIYKHQSSNESWNAFLEIISTNYDKCFPLKKLSIKKYKTKPWITEGLKKSSKIKENLYLTWKKNKTAYNKVKYNKYRNTYNNLLKSAKAKYYENFFISDTSNKKMWNEINQIKGKSKQNNIIKKIKVEDKLIENDTQIANALNNFFSTVGEKMNTNFKTSDIDFHRYMPIPLDKSIKLNYVTEEEIYKIIDKMPNKTSCGHDKISQKLIKINKDLLAPHVTILINKAIKEKCYPDCLKLTKIIPLHKGGCRLDCNNYRPISLLSSFNKIFEKKIHNDLSNFIESNTILYQNQFGFRKYHSTIDALINMHDYIINERRKNNKIAGIFIDLKKAFDTIDNKILINKLPYYGISGPYNKLIESYLINRRTYTYLNNMNSNENNIKFGVPQGSVLGPLLFTLYINDIKTLSEASEISLFADDTSIFCSENNYEKLNFSCNNILQKCNEWLKCNKLTLNTKKTHFVDFSKATNNSNLILSINSEKIEQKNYTKYLGMIIQSDLKWNKHINDVIKKLNSQIPLYYQIRHILPANHRIMIFNSLSLSKINYGIELYGKSKSTCFNQLQKTQNRLLKILLKKSPFHNTNNIHKVNKILKIRDHTHLRLLLLGHKKVYESSKINIAYKNLTINNYSGRTLRNNLMFNTSTTHYLNHNTVLEKVAITWNGTDKLLLELANRDKFKNEIKKTLLTKY